MGYIKVDYEEAKTFCEHVFAGYGFSEEESRQITDVLLAADLSGIESHGLQRLIRRHLHSLCALRILLCSSMSLSGGSKCLTGSLSIGSFGCGSL